MIHPIEILREAMGFSTWWEHQEHYFNLLPKIIEERAPIRFFISVPCGWGKTEIALIPFLSQFVRGDTLRFSSKMLYILPSQALVTDIIRRIKEYINKLCERLQFESIKVERDDGIEREINLLDVYRGDVVVTTMDSYLARLLSSPLVSKKHRHYFVGKSLRALCVLDEIHSYELYSLGFIKRLMEFYNKVNMNNIVMSASLNKLQQNMLGLVEEKGYATKVIYKPARDCATIRYRDDLHYNGQVLDYVRCVVELLNEILRNGSLDRRILIMCNTVNKAQATYKELKRNFHGLNLSLLHSRFKIKEKEDYVRKATKEILPRKIEKHNESGGVLVSTQVIESGVDISADLLISEIAPPDALIQRFGRCARELRCPTEPKTRVALGEIHVIPVKLESIKNIDEKPYPYPWVLASQAVFEKHCGENNKVMDAELIEELVKATPAPLRTSQHKDFFYITNVKERSLSSFIEEYLGIRVEREILKRLYQLFIEGQKEAGTWIEQRIWGYVEGIMPRFRHEERINLMIEKKSVELLFGIKGEIEKLRFADNDVLRNENYLKEKKLWEKMHTIIQEDSVRVNKKTLRSSVQCIYENTYYDPTYSYTYDREFGLISKKEEEDA
jgi:CRISPR-associated helicase Cas3